MAFITNLFKSMLDAIAVATGSYGIAIMGMALVVMIITFPLNWRQMQTSYKMKLINPKVEEIKKKYKDPDKANEELLALWKEYDINPAAGCLPVFIQLPIIMAMFGVLRMDGVFDMNPTFLGLNLIWPDAQHSFWSLVTENFAYAVVPILAVATTVIQQRQVMANAAEPSMRAMSIFLPVFTGWLTINYPTALGIYWVSRNVLTIGQHYLVTRKLESQLGLEGGVQGNDKRGKARKND